MEGKKFTVVHNACEKTRNAFDIKTPTIILNDGSIHSFLINHAHLYMYSFFCKISFYQFTRKTHLN